MGQNALSAENMNSSRLSFAVTFNPHPSSMFCPAFLDIRKRSRLSRNHGHKAFIMASLATQFLQPEMHPRLPYSALMTRNGHSSYHDNLFLDLPYSHWAPAISTTRHQGSQERRHSSSMVASHVSLNCGITTGYCSSKSLNRTEGNSNIRQMLWDCSCAEN